MPHALWKGTLSFGLVEIPVRLQSAVAREDEISFTMLDRHDFSPVGNEHVNKRTRKPVEWKDIVKGYEYDKGAYVTLTEAEVKAANPKASQSIDIVDFIDGKDIESVFWESPYYLEPSNKKSKSYVLLRETLAKSGKVGIAQVVIRTRQRLAALTVRGPAIVLNILRYAYELRDPKKLEIPTESPKSLGITDKEIALAQQVVESMAAPWKPDRYTDTYRKEILALVQRKVKSGKVHDVVEVEDEDKPREKAGGDVLDLMPLLRESVAKGKKVVAAERPRRAPKTRRKRA